MFPEDMFLKSKDYQDYEVSIMKKELISRIAVGLLGGIVICYLITIGISISLGDGFFIHVFQDW